MAKLTRSLWSLALITASAVSFAGCDSGGPGVDSVPQGEAVLVGLEVTPGGGIALVVRTGDRQQFTATGTYSDGATADLTDAVTWTSTDASVAAISNDGGTRGLATFGVAGGAELTATDPATGASAAVGVSVSAASLVALDVSPLDASLLVGSTLQLTATATLDDVDESTADLTSIVTWTSADETVATISAGGLVTARALGTATITAVDPVSGASATTSVIVTPVFGLSYVSLSRGSVIGGGSVQITGMAVLTAVASDPVELALWTTSGATPSSPASGAVTVPASVVVPAGADRVSFPVTTASVAQKTRAFVWASDGLLEKSASLNVRKQR